jgi:hypothetical protein
VEVKHDTPAVQDRPHPLCTATARVDLFAAFYAKCPECRLCPIVCLPTLRNSSLAGVTVVFDQLMYKFEFGRMHHAGLTAGPRAQRGLAARHRAQKSFARC